ncbi:MAG: DUF1848 domain-containing protein [Clostridia bacterium]|jgi:hypothetical protein|nr:DUF1848 domain-containing protein [Clostridia bacterium]
MILSVSRRTDIPAFYSNWFFDRLKDGYVLVPNPINPSKIARIKLESISIKNIEIDLIGQKKVEMQGNIEGIVFWTKNPMPMFDKLHLLEDIPFYFLYTLNAYPDNVEANLPSLQKRIESFKELSRHCPVIWRYDPILLAEGIDVEWHKQKFEMLCNELKGHTKHCKISFVIESYRGCSKKVWAPNLAQKNEILLAFSNIAKENNVQIEACAESGDWSKYGIATSKCIDREIFEQLLSEKYKDQNIIVTRKNNKLDGQRKYCGCMPAIDIGRYDTCKHGCNYCYARKNTPKNMYDILNGEIYERKTELEFEYK